MTIQHYDVLLSPFVLELPRFSVLAAAVLRQAKDLIALLPSLTMGFSQEAAEGIQLDKVWNVSKGEGR